MGLTTSLYTGLSGLNNASQLISVAGNNIANVNTTAYKASRIDFQTQISETRSRGSAPTTTLGGTNPTQVGLGTRVGGVTRNFGNGSVQPTGVNTEMAIEGNGFFIVDDAGSQRYSRAGNFKLDNALNLVTQSGALVQGWGVDRNFNVQVGSMGPMKIDLGNLRVAEATKNVRFSGNLNGAGTVGVNRSVINSGTLYTDNTQTTQATATDLMTNLYDGNGALMFNANDVITISDASKGGATLPDHTFQIGAANTTSSDANGTTLQDFLDFLTDTLGVNKSISGDPAGATITNGQIVVTGNKGAVNDLDLQGADLILNKGSSTPSTPFSFNKSSTADGESVRTTFTAYDSLGSTMTFNLSVVLDSKTNAGSTWRFFVESEDDSRLMRNIGTGTLLFDTNGQIDTISNNAITINRGGTGGGSIQSINLRFDQPAGAMSALADVSSQLSSLSQDGTQLGTLEDFSVGSDGVIRGIFSNSQTRTLGQLVLATFTNPQGLVEKGSDLYEVTASSGDASVLTPQSGGAGKIIGGAIELSNVDLSQEFINLITASTGFSANSRMLTTGDRLIQELLQTIR